MWFWNTRTVNYVWHWISTSLSSESKLYGSKYRSHISWVLSLQSLPFPRSLCCIWPSETFTGTQVSVSWGYYSQLGEHLQPNPHRHQISIHIHSSMCTHTFWKREKHLSLLTGWQTRDQHQIQYNWIRKSTAKGNLEA